MKTSAAAAPPDAIAEQIAPAAPMGIYPAIPTF